MLVVSPEYGAASDKWMSSLYAYDSACFVTKEFSSDIEFIRYKDLFVEDSCNFP